MQLLGCIGKAVLNTLYHMLDIVLSSAQIFVFDFIEYLHQAFTLFMQGPFGIA